MASDQENLDKGTIAYLTYLDQRLNLYPRLKYAILHHRNIHAEAMTFHDKPFLVEIYKDNAQEVVLQSSVQTGKSEYLIVAAHEAAESGLQVLYVLPTIEIRNLFVANRVDKLYTMSPHYQRIINNSTGVSDSRGLKHFGKKGGAIFFAGSNSATTFIEKPIDEVIGDEIDRFDLHNYEKADDRMTASKYKIKREASNPTVDKFGINRRYLESDQREFYVVCSGCNMWQKMDWFKNAVEQTDENGFRLLDDRWEEGCGRDIHLVCIRCGKPLQRFSHRSQWVSRFPKRMNCHGYLIHQMLSVYVKIEEMWKKFSRGLSDDNAMQVFYNSMLGLPFAGKGSKLTDEILNSCKYEYLMPEKADTCFMGVDVGKKLHVVIYRLLPGEKLQLVYAGTVREFEELDYLFARFGIVTYVIDAMPETRKATEYANKQPGRGWICRYHQGLDEVKTNDDTRQVSADRTMIMDRMMSFFIQKRILLPQNAQSLDRGDFYEQLKNPTRVFDHEKNRFDYLGDQDHHFHASTYALLAYLVRGEMRVVGLNTNPQIQVSRPPEKLEEGILFSPGTPESVKEHYRRLFNQAHAGYKDEDADKG